MFTTVRSAIETPGDTDVFRLFPGSSNIRVQVLGVDGGGGTLPDLVLNVYFGTVDGTPEVTIDNFITRDPLFDFALNGQKLFLEIAGFQDATGVYSLSVETLF